MNYNKNYVEKNLIAYIGNKRRLLPLINSALSTIKLTNKDTSFLDLFAGTGVVSRLAKSLGYEVHTNDWEYYSYVMNHAFISLDNSIIRHGFQKLGGMSNAINILNALKKPSKKGRYLCEFYCPHDDAAPNPEKERMYYTQYNGLKIDAIREQIENWHNDDAITNDEQMLLLALLLYEASTRSNTSGVFKAFHHGFGGKNGDALSRIMKEVELAIPTLCQGNGFAYQDDALEIAKKLSNKQVDIAYLDPPYNQHQYGSNYHLLNTIARNDKPEVLKEFMIQGKKVDKSAIRKDWTVTRSNFCYKGSAEEEFAKLIDTINAKHLLISYSTDGIIPFDNFLDIISHKGKLSIVTSEYEKYRGGKQALTSQLKNVEFITMIDTTQKKSIYDINAIRKDLIMDKIIITLKKTISQSKLEKRGYYFHNSQIEESLVWKLYGQTSVEFKIVDGQVATKEELTNQLYPLTYGMLEEILQDFEFATDLTREDEIYLSLEMIENHIRNGNEQAPLEILSNIPYYLSKFNNRKAYKPSLIVLKKIFTMLHETIDFWHAQSLLENKIFHRIEMLLLSKLNHTHTHETEKLKKEIGMLYDNLHDALSTKMPIQKQMEHYQDKSQIC